MSGAKTQAQIDICCHMLSDISQMCGYNIRRAFNVIVLWHLNMGDRNSLMLHKQSTQVLEKQLRIKASSFQTEKEMVQ